VPKVRLLSYNVRGLRDDPDAVATVVRHCQPDVLVVQEGPRRLRWRPRCAALARACGLFYVAGGRPAGGNVLFATARVRVHEVLEWRIPVPLDAPMRGIVAATLSVEGARFRVVGAHLSLAASERAREVTQVLAAAQLDTGLPLLLAGDLNEGPTGPSWATLRRAGLRDVCADEGARPTYPAHAPRARIDAVFVSDPDVEVLQGGVPADPDLRSLLPRASDHLPVLAELVVSEPGSSASGQP
jgi:endonuclease/exonuclease/phosphatase family metal-dependent hydrolase